MANKTKRAEREKVRLAKEAMLKNALSTSKKERKAVRSQDVAQEFYRDLQLLYGTKFIRPLDSWRAPRSKRPDKIKRDLARHLLQKYPVPIFFNRAFASDDINGLYRDWYVVVAQGVSLYKSTVIREILNKREVHVLMTEAPVGNTLHQNLWWSKAYVTSGNNRAFADLVARSNLADFGSNDAVLQKRRMIAWDRLSFWSEVLLFFSRNYVSLNKFNDYLDFLQRNDVQTMRGRTLRGLALLRDAWHMRLAENEGSAATWDGAPIPDKSYAYKHSDGTVRYEFRQIKNGKDLAKEGRIMHHCVYAYLHYCVEGRSSIWTVIKKSVNALDVGGRVATIEVGKDDTIVDVRGKWNGQPRKDVIAAVNRWAMRNNLGIPRGLKLTGLSEYPET